MRQHMLKYHVAIPLIVLAALIAVGVSAASALSTAIAVGCVSMVVMATGGHHGNRSGTHRPETSGAPGDTRRAR